MKMIVVNATALRSGGALTILHQFIQSTQNDKNYLVFVHPSVDLQSKENIRIIKIDRTSFLSRILWDFSGLNKYLSKYQIRADVVVSLQNTTVRVNQKCSQVVYLHNIIPFSNYPFRWYKKAELKLILYKYFYSFFIFLYADRNTKYIVQSEWFKNVLVKREISSANIQVAAPNMLPKREYNPTKQVVDSEYVNAFYPASALEYKNHIEIVKAIIYLKEHYVLHKPFKVYFTVSSDNSLKLKDFIKNHNLDSNFVFLGDLTYDDVMSFYRDVDLVLFPSKLETFGLPLIEAATLNKKVVAIDMPYSREVLKGYDDVIYCKVNDSKSWADGILQILQKKSNKTSFSSKNDWPKVHKFIKEMEKNV